MKFYCHRRGLDIKWLPKLRTGRDPFRVFTIAATWLSWSLIWRCVRFEACRG